MPGWRSAAILLALLAVLGATAGPAGAIPATGGDGRFGPAIQWADWGPNGTVLPIDPGGAPFVRTTVSDVAGRELRIHCQLDFPTGAPLSAYRSGGWSGDVLDDLYHRGGPGTANTLANAIKVSGGAHASVSLLCSASLDGTVGVQSYGFVLADAEQNGAVEYLEARLVPGAGFHVLDRRRSPGCTADQSLRREYDASVSSTLRFGGPTGPLCAEGPAGVVAVGGTGNARITLSGTSALAAGLVIPIDHGDAPASYGDAAHLWAPTINGTQLPIGDTGLFGGTALGSPSAAPYRLGATVDPDGDTGFASAGADADDGAGAPAFGPADDEDADPPAAVTVDPGGPLTLPPVPCTGAGVLAAWIDVDDDGTFGADERSADAPCSGGTATPAWTVPADAVEQPAASLRLRYAETAADVAGPTGVAFSGEVEDHRLAVVVPVPTVVITSPGTGTRITVGARTPAAFACAAGGGVASCGAEVEAPDGSRAAVAPGAPVPATVPGRHVLTARVVDASGRTATASRAYDVLAAPFPGTVPGAGTPPLLGTGTPGAGSPAGSPSPGSPAGGPDAAPPGRLVIAADASRTRVRPGARVVVRLRVANRGGRPLRDVRVCERLPARLAFVSSTIRSTRVRGGRCWTLRRLAPDARVAWSSTVRADRRIGRPVVRVTGRAAGSRDASATVALRVR